ncbi:hypothetical protein AB0L13_43545 [Saccharopolyspora shandongensis]|uniref:hypothetical protein n=1 Tax=Saccharopolyspora shandongensis TaxID=418495 RepID=UPI0034253E1A
MSIYVSWSYPAEVGRNPAELDNRFSTMTEVRRVAWPAYEEPRWSDPLQFQQGIAGSLELFFWAWVPFQSFVEETTGHAVPVYQRIDQAGFRTLLDDRVLADTDTLFVFGLDHMITGQDAEPEEIAALREFLQREGTCLQDRPVVHGQGSGHQRVVGGSDHLQLPPAPAALPVTAEEPDAIRVLARQPIDTSRPHPFTVLEFRLGAGSIPAGRTNPR